MGESRLTTRCSCWNELDENELFRAARRESRGCWLKESLTGLLDGSELDRAARWEREG